VPGERRPRSAVRVASTGDWFTLEEVAPGAFGWVRLAPAGPPAPPPGWPAGSPSTPPTGPYVPSGGGPAGNQPSPTPPAAQKAPGRQSRPRVCGPECPLTPPSCPAKPSEEASMSNQPSACQNAACGASLAGRQASARYCCPACRLIGWAAAKARQPHRRRRPRTWEVLDPAAVPREFLVLSAARIDRALREGREVAGIKKL